MRMSCRAGALRFHGGFMCGSHFFSNYSVINHENIVHVALHNFFAHIEREINL